MMVLAIAAHPYAYVRPPQCMSFKLIDPRIATYSQVERDFRLFSSEKGSDEGPLFEVEFFGILLDEGDNIKNYGGNSRHQLS